MKLKYTVLIVWLALSSVNAFSQHEYETALPYSLELMQKDEREKNFRPRTFSGDRNSLTLPFFDDFSRYSLPTNNPSIPTEWQRWTDNSVLINETFPISPLTIGVATFDGMKNNGRPYIDTTYFPNIHNVNLPWGPCDSLTSLPIDLSGYTAEDNVYLMFHYQAGGWGNKPEVSALFSQGDSLTLEFFTPLNNGEWFRVWQTGSTDDTDEFFRVLIHVADPIYFQDGFRFRFINKGTKMGAVDHWHLDYVYLSDDFDEATFDYEEVAQQYPLNTLLNFDYTAMPWTHFVANPGLYMKSTFSYYQRNLGPTKNIVTRWKVSHNGTVIKTGENLVDGQSNDHRELVKTVSTENFIYNSSDVNTSEFEVCVYHDPTDGQVANDTTCFTQGFYNYYAYDDGTAERAYGLESAGGKVAVRFTSEIADTLYGVYMYYLPFMYLADNQSFFLQAWGQGAGVPGAIISENFTFQEPSYEEDGGPNQFVFYRLDEPIVVEGQFYIGWVQQNNVSLNIGLDKNTNANASKLFYQLGGTSSWSTSSIQGSLMMRPVFKSGMPDWISVEEETVPLASIYPNPTRNELNLQLTPDYNNYMLEVMDVSGRKMMVEQFNNTGHYQLNTSRLSEGVYVLRLTESRSGKSMVKRFVVE
jgi:hypothetical protein